MDERVCKVPNNAVAAFIVMNGLVLLLELFPAVLGVVVVAARSTRCTIQ